ncbi:MAG: hypothetical protein IT207_07590 [Fimbriimonadaceae bacterium]|nr:hypothetical protein [Fimbriimonadaceae bacterium]
MVDRVLSVPNWSFARQSSLVREAAEVLGAFDVQVHFCAGDLDHNRTVTAFSGDPASVQAALMALARAVLDSVDLTRHTGVHPRIGGLDVCPFVPLGPVKDEASLKAWIEQGAAMFAEEFGVPVFLYERSERGRHEAALPELRRGGFGGLLTRALDPDFGPVVAHPRLGATVWGWRDFLVAMNVNLGSDDLAISRQIAQRIRNMRAEGDERMIGVRALGLPLLSRGQTQVSLNVTMPDSTPLDPILKFVADQASLARIHRAQFELIGVIRDRDLPGAQTLPHEPEQVISIQEGG